MVLPLEARGEILQFLELKKSDGELCRDFLLAQLKMSREILRDLWQLSRGNHPFPQLKLISVLESAFDSGLKIYFFAGYINDQNDCLQVCSLPVVEGAETKSLWAARIVDLDDSVGGGRIINAQIIDPNPLLDGKVFKIGSPSISRLQRLRIGDVDICWEVVWEDGEIKDDAVKMRHTLFMKDFVEMVEKNFGAIE